MHIKWLFEWLSLFEALFCIMPVKSSLEIREKKREEVTSRHSTQPLILLSGSQVVMLRKSFLDKLMRYEGEGWGEFSRQFILLVCSIKLQLIFYKKPKNIAYHICQKIANVHWLDSFYFRILLFAYLFRSDNEAHSYINLTQLKFSIVWWTTQNHWESKDDETLC